MVAPSVFIALQAALALTPEMLKRTIAARMPRIAMTTSNSTRVKPPWLRCERRRASLSSARSMVVVLPPSSLSRLGVAAGRVRLGIHRVELDLDDPTSIAQVDEDQTTEVAPPMHPAVHVHLASDLIGSNRAGGHARGQAH